ncbi:MAG: hypothetical protein WBP63_06885 [Silvibacterium sp.]
MTATPLALAIKACVDSYWKYRRTPESIDALLRAGAAIAGIEIPGGYDEDRRASPPLLRFNQAPDQQEGRNRRLQDGADRSDCLDSLP